ncbi:MAG TPA: VOC family protein [Acidimicrobiales bacterium]|nr:VOC family protein [Acidimicrobiales bacterium]
MGERSAHAPGTPSWVDLGVPDVERAGAFYSSLLGWEIESMGPEAGGYAMATLDGMRVAGLGPAQDPGPPRWTTYVTVADVEASVAAVLDAGGAVVVPAFDVLTAGRQAVVADPIGAVLSLWQPGESIGAELVNVPGSLCWNELNGRPLADAMPFYASVFGWTFDGTPDDGYVQFRLGSRTIGGMLPTDRMPDIPNHWAVYFAVASHDEAAARVRELGGQVYVEGQVAEGTGTFSVCADDQGASFCIIELLEADD